MLTSKSVRLITGVTFTAMLAFGVILAGGCDPAKKSGPGETSGPGAGDGAATIGLRHAPLPVVSEGQGLLAFLSTTGVVYVWGGECARPVYDPGSGFSVKGLALSPQAGGPYLAVTEAPAGTTDRPFTNPTRVTIVNLHTGGKYQALPLHGILPAQGTPVTTLQWSDDGSELFVNGDAPVVMAVGDEAATVAWDLAGVVPEGAEMREPLMAPDFSRLAFSLFQAEPDVGEDLWMVDRPASGASAPHNEPAIPRRLTTGNRGGYPVRWLGARPDGSDPAGRQSHVLVKLGAVSTGGGISTGLAVVNADTGTGEVWYAEGATVHRPVVIDLVGGRALVGLFHSMTGEDGRALWHALNGATPDKAVPALSGYQVTCPAVMLDDRTAAVLARDPEALIYEYWLVSTDGSARRLGAAAQGEDAYLLDGTIGGRAFVLTVATDGSGATRCTLKRVIAEEGRLENVQVSGAAGQ